MGMPACRISDTTAHGGIVTVGYPTVLIGFLPASRIGDLHTCPVVDGVVPHVGGPFILGSPTVLVGMMPQSRVTDQLTCVGPPDVALTGEFTVLVGMAGAGGVMGASMGVVTMGAAVPMASPPPASGGSPAAQQGLAAPELDHARTTASLQNDGTTRTLARPGSGLPPIELKQVGWPDLPPEITCTFQSVQPANILPGTTLYALADADAEPGCTCFWTADAPTGGAAGNAWNTTTHVLVHTVRQGSGIRGWAGEGVTSGKLQIWTPSGTTGADSTRRFRLSGTP